MNVCEGDNNFWYIYEIPDTANTALICNTNVVKCSDISDY